MTGDRGGGWHTCAVGGVGELRISQVTAPGDADPELAKILARCWAEVTNAGGAAGFPFPPVTASQVEPAAAEIIAGLHPDRSRLVLAEAGSLLAGWVSIRRDLNPLIAHWGTINHLQARPACQGRGIGTALMTRASTIAREDMGLEQLRLAFRGGTGLEHFYTRLGWEVTGRWPAALRFGPGDDRDEILMTLRPL
jgi:GNAT superfamily N-acetyltransferase